MARPSKLASQVRAHRITVRLSDTELVELFERSDQVGLPPSSFMRETALGKKLPMPIPEINLKVHQELGRVGNNLNQLLKNFHRGKAQTMPAETIEELLGLLRAIREELRGR